MGTKTNRALQAKAMKLRTQRHVARIEATFKSAAFSYAQEHKTVPGAYPVYWTERAGETSAQRRARLRKMF